jgi:hypothetical protein
MKSFYRSLTAAAFLLATFTAQASTASYTGAFSSDDEIQGFTFTLIASGSVTAQTWSFGGGTNAAGNVIAAGGFAPTLSLFNMTPSSDYGVLLQSVQSGASGSCPSGANSDPASGFCWDVGFTASLQAGTYLLALTQDTNTPFGPTFTDGFLQTGRGNFTGPDYLGQPGQCILVDGSQRSCAWAVDIALPTTAPVPLPGGLVLLVSGLLALFGLRRRTI